jgi:Tol biopolymer transport system component
MRSFFFAKWSPDGRAFLLGGTSDKGQFGLHIADAQTGGLTATLPNGYWGFWSPDGRSIFYARNDPATKSRPLVVRDLKSGEDRVLVPGFVGMGAAVSPDGSRIAFSSLSGESYGSSTLQVMSLKDSQLHEIFKLNSPEDFGTLTWSPDGARLYFVRRNFKKSKFEVWQIPVQGGEPQAVGVSTTAISPISLHPDGKRMAFGAGQNKAEVWVMENFLK